MIIWTIKLYRSLKTAIAGRRYPHQLAAAVAFGALLGVVPHGNLLALAILIVVLSLRVNHAMAGITAIGVSFAATRLDAYSHAVGNHILTSPHLSDYGTRAWQLPVVPWTDLNNTVVMGSFVIGLVALLPLFLVTYPIFRLFAPTAVEEAKTEVAEIKQSTRNVAKHSVVLVDQGHDGVTAPHVLPEREAASVESMIDSMRDGDSQTRGTNVESTLRYDTSASTLLPDEGQTDQGQKGEELQDEDSLRVETRIDVIRMSDYRDEQVATSDASTHQSDQTTNKPATADAASSTPPPSDEALNYLLRQLRDSQQQRKAA